MKLTISEHANKALKAEQKKDWKKAAELWQEAANACFTPSAKDSFNEFSQRCSNKMKGGE